MPFSCLLAEKVQAALISLWLQVSVHKQTCAATAPSVLQEYLLLIFTDGNRCSHFSHQIYPPHKSL